ncbi:MAG: dienelactone hydrolase family protein, partial [Acidimicrobiales bacterium]
HVYEGTGHGFTNEENPLGTYDPDATEIAYRRALALLSTVS